MPVVRFDGRIAAGGLLLRPDGSIQKALCVIDDAPTDMAIERCLTEAMGLPALTGLEGSDEYLRLLYSDRLRSGMTKDDIRSVLTSESNTQER